MNKYLLLRDNKQSGPYSVEELSAHGLKPYDLVWLEGKSAAWRYPSEIAELKPFAPVVEEQPFDRFYRKPENKTIESAAKDNTAVAASSFLQGEAKKSDLSGSLTRIELNTGSGNKIHVSLPTKTSVSSPTTPEQIQKSSTPVSFQTEKQPVDVSPMMKKSSSLDASVNSSIEGGDRTQNIEHSHFTKQQHTTPKEAPVSRLLFRAVAAACLLLGGALIGLIINYNSQQKKFQQLNQLVQEIKLQDNPGTAKTVKNDRLTEEARIAQADSGEPPTETEEPVYKEDIQLPPPKKNRSENKAKPVRDTTTEIKVVPEAAETVLEEEPVTRIDKVASELAKKNLWQLVTIDNNKYKTGVFGGVSNLSLKLSNKSLLQLQQVEVEVLYLSPENKTVNKQRVVFENVSPGEQLQLAVPKSNRGVKIEYSIKKIATKEFELAHAGS